MPSKERYVEICINLQTLWLGLQTLWLGASQQQLGISQQLYIHPPFSLPENKKKQERAS